MRNLFLLVSSILIITLLLAIFNIDYLRKTDFINIRQYFCTVVDNFRILNSSDILTSLYNVPIYFPILFIPSKPFSKTEY